MLDRIRARSQAAIGGLDRWSLAHSTTRIARRAVAGFLAHDALQYAGSMAYFGVLSIFQLLVLGIVVASFVVGEGQARQLILDQVAGGSPLDPELIGGVIDAVIDSRGGITAIGFVFLVWSALGVFSSLSTGIGRAFEAAPRRGFLQDRLLGLLLMGITGVLAVGSVVIGVVTGIIQGAAADVVARVPGGGTALWLIGFIVPIILIFVAFWIIYRVVPNRRVTFGEVLPGALVAALLWTVLRVGFTYYATSIARYDSAFGPISTGITLLVFLYFASVIVLLGAEVARARALDDELPAGIAADPRFMPVPVGPPAVTAAGRPARRGLPRWALLAGGALLGVIAGRLSRRGDEDE